MRLPAQLLRRKADSHKGDFGHVLIIAGSPRFSGAAVLCAAAALRSGAGLVTMAVPEGLNSPLIRIKPPEVMTLPLPQTRQGSLSAGAYRALHQCIEKADVVAIGPGLSQDVSTQNLVRRLIASVSKPRVIDADALNALAGHTGLLLKTNNQQLTTILTPHPGEMSRLIGEKVGVSAAGRRNVAKEFAKVYNCITVLKGHGTVVADPQGDTYVNRTGNPGMATAGSGDVLTGMIAAFLGQGLDGFAAAKYAVYVHGLAGDIAAKEKTQISLIASDIIAKIPEAIRRADGSGNYKT